MNLALRPSALARTAARLRGPVQLLLAPALVASSRKAGVLAPSRATINRPSAISRDRIANGALPKIHAAMHVRRDTQLSRESIRALARHCDRGAAV